MNKETGSKQKGSHPVVAAETLEQDLARPSRPSPAEEDVEKAGADTATGKEFESICESQRSTYPKNSDIIDWEGSDDTSRPLNWSPVKKWTNIVLISILTLLTYVSHNRSPLSKSSITHSDYLQAICIIHARTCNQTGHARVRKYEH